MLYKAPMAFHPPRGIAPELLISQVRNTAPYLFGQEGASPLLSSSEPAQFVRDCAGRLETWQSGAHLEPPSRAAADFTSTLTHFEYFKLCLSSHYLSCATPVPTDVDHQIRFKLWHEQLPLETSLQMTDLALQSRGWDFREISKRFLMGAPSSPWATEVLSGHQGEWFTVACASYGALTRSTDSAAIQKRQEVLEQITHEIHRHSEIFASLWNAQDGLGCLRASALIAHNLGDLDRVMDLWELSSVDPLRLQFYQLTSKPLDSLNKLRYRGRLWVAGELYKSEILGSSMALENHRHFALRKPRGLRQRPEFLIPLGPFFDSWGQTAAQSLAEQAQEVLDALTHGWSRLPQTVGYGRALCGMLHENPKLRDAHPGLTEIFKTKKNRKLLETSQEAFESQWNGEALKKMEVIPSQL